MRILLLSLFTLLTMQGSIGLNTQAPVDATGTVSMVRKNVDSADPKTVGIMLVVSSMTWKAFEAQDHYFPPSKSGPYKVISPNLVILRNTDDSQRVGQLNPIIPGQAKPGDTLSATLDVSGFSLSCTVN
jgi:hypothetical protein